MNDPNRAPKGGGKPKAAKKRHGRSWLAKRERAGRSWHERKMRSRRYCAPQPVRNG